MIARFALLGILIAAAFGVVPVPVAAAAPVEITVTGQGTVTQLPDVATLNAAVETNADVAADATGQNNATYDKIVAALKALGIAETDIQTSSYNLSYNPPPSPAPRREETVGPYHPRYGYIVYRGLSVKVRHTEDVGKVIDACIAAGATNVNGVFFGIEDNHAAYDRALKLAVNDAQRQAQAMASAAHLRILRLKSIQQGYAPVGPVPLRMAVAAPIPAGAPTTIEPNNVQVRATVTVTYEASP